MIYAEKVIVNGVNWIKVNFKPLPEIIHTMNSVPNVSFNPATKNWAVPYENRKQFEEIMGNHLILWRGEEVESGGIPEESIPDKPVVPFNFKTKPFDFQIRGFNAMYERNFLILGDDMGLGNYIARITRNRNNVEGKNGEVLRKIG
jgi:SNF2 family DNA or RNA helicase